MALKNNRVNINDGGNRAGGRRSGAKEAAGNLLKETAKNALGISGGTASAAMRTSGNSLQSAYNDYRKSYVKNDISASKPINNGGGQMMRKTLARKVDNGGQMMNRRIKAPTKTNVVPGKKREKSVK